MLKSLNKFLTIKLFYILYFYFINQLKLTIVKQDAYKSMLLKEALKVKATEEIRKVVKYPIMWNDWIFISVHSKYELIVGEFCNFYVDYERQYVTACLNQTPLVVD